MKMTSVKSASQKTQTTQTTNGPSKGQSGSSATLRWDVSLKSTRAPYNSAQLATARRRKHSQQKTILKAHKANPISGRDYR